MAMLMRKMKTKYAIYAILGLIFEKRSGVFFSYVITFFQKALQYGRLKPQEPSSQQDQCPWNSDDAPDVILTFFSWFKMFK